MPDYRRGDILQAEVDALVNTVNCVGIMGRGIALQFRNAFPDNFKAYKAACDRNEVQPGRMFVVETGQLNPRFIVNFPTKRHWRGKSRMVDIDAGLADLIVQIKSLGIRSIALPPLGCGLGGLDWREVRPRIEQALAQIPDVHAVVFEPAEAPPAAEMVRAQNAPSMTPGRAALVGLLRRYLDGLMDPAVSLLEAYKLMYFMQEAGEDLSLKFVEGRYGPYADNLRHVLARVEGYHLSGFRDGGENPEKVLELIPGAAEEAERFLVDHPESLERFERVGRLVDGFETSYGLELLATVHWIVKREGTEDPDEVRRFLARWSERKKMFTREQVVVALEALGSQGWLADVKINA